EILSTMNLITDDPIPGYPDWSIQEMRIYQQDDQTNLCPIYFSVSRYASLNNTSMGAATKNFWIILNCTVVGTLVTYCSSIEKYNNGLWDYVTDGVPTDGIHFSGGGSVGIGVNPPIRQLHSASATVSNEFIMEVEDGLADWKKWNFVVAGGAANAQNMYLRILNDVGAASSMDAMTWLANGNVGVGSMAPAAKLDVVGDITASTTITAGTGLTVTAGDAAITDGNLTVTGAGNGTITAASDITTTAGALLFTDVNNRIAKPAANELAFYTNNSEKMSINSTGIVDIQNGVLVLNKGNGSVGTNSDIYFNGQGLIASQSSLYINIDSDNNQANASLFIKTNAETSGGLTLLKVDEDGTVTTTNKVLLDTASIGAFDAVAPGTKVANTHAVNKQWVWDFLTGIQAGAMTDAQREAIVAHILAGTTADNYAELETAIHSSLNSTSAVCGDDTWTKSVVLTGGVVTNTCGGFSANVTMPGALIVTTNLTVSSDKRLKKNIKKLDSSLAKIIRLEGVEYFWKDRKKSKRKQIGLIAQELLKVFPELVEKSPGDKYYSVNYIGLIAPLIEATKEQQEQIEELKQENEQMRRFLCDKFNNEAQFCN
ncbi:MAG: hypothetical protein HON90_08505, partial [Halobacteriovoraceae bacterium]|nr:hypothetical protein [Halobacteriovoraceae bacterium]